MIEHVTHGQMTRIYSQRSDNMREAAMKHGLASEARHLLRSPLVAFKEVFSLLSGEREHSRDEKADKSVKIIIDSDGNATLNLRNEEVQRAMKAHIDALAEIKVDKPKGESETNR
jgi:hypothetical protein